jgi:chaperonin GroEL (HSP60 family)
MVDEAERAMNDALSVVADVVKQSKIVPGGGAIEMEISKELREYSTKVGGREQLAIETFADSLEIVPKTLVENAGLDPIDKIVALRSAHEQPKGEVMGIDVFTGDILNLHEKGIIEPMVVKEQAIKSAAEVAAMILRIDDVIASGKSAAPPMPPGGAGGMPGGMPPY